MALIGRVLNKLDFNILKYNKIVKNIFHKSKEGALICPKIRLNIKEIYPCLLGDWQTKIRDKGHF